MYRDKVRKKMFNSITQGSNQNKGRRTVKQKRKKIFWGSEEFWQQVRSESSAYQREDLRQRKEVKEALIRKSVKELEAVEVPSIQRFLLHREIREEIQEIGYTISHNKERKLILI